MSVDYLQQAKDDFEQSQGDVTDGYNAILKQYAQIKALLALGTLMQDLIMTIDNLSSDLQNIDFTLSRIADVEEQNRREGR